MSTKVEEVKLESKDIQRSKNIRSSLLKEGEDLYQWPFTEKENTLALCLKYTIDKYGDKKCYGYREVIKEHQETTPSGKSLVTYEHGPLIQKSYKEVDEMISSFGSGLMNFDKKLKNGSKVCIYLDTCFSWIIACHGCFRQGITVTTAYANLGLDALAKVINECDISTLICDASAVKHLEETVKPNAKCLKNLVIVNETDYQPKTLKVMKFNDVMDDGEKNKKKENWPGPEDLAFIMYTSGTTGDPKGVMIRHRNVLASSEGVGSILNIVDSDVYLSYLPLAHIFELVSHHTLFFKGCFIGFGTPRTLIAKPGGALRTGDLIMVKPTLLIGVPRVWDTIKKGVTAKVRAAGGIKQCLFNFVLKNKLGQLKKFQNKSVMLENVVFKKVKEMVGGKLRLVVSGGAALSPESHLFLQAALGKDCSVLQGYGLTETCAGATIQNPRYFAKTAVLGEAIPCSLLKLEDVPDLGYFTSDTPPKGEILVSGGNVTLGYYKKEEITKEVFGEDGYFHTGDIGQLNEDNTITIIDRKKNLVKLSQGEYVALESLEAIYGENAFVLPNGLCITPNPLKSYIAAIMLLDPVYVKFWAKGEKIPTTDVKEILKHEKLKPAILDAFDKIAKKYGKKGFERIRDVKFYHDLWTPENGMATASSKLKRKDLTQKYKADIDEMYVKDL